MGRRLCRTRTSTDQEESTDAGHVGDGVVGGDGGGQITASFTLSHGFNPLGV